MTDASIWQADFVVPAALAPAIQDRLDGVPDFPDDGICSQFEETRDSIRFALFLSSAPPAALLQALQAAAQAPLHFAPLPDEDWVTLSNHAVTPFTAGRFHVTPHVPARRRLGTVIVPAGLAFGTGQHETTRGCLHLIESVLRRRGVKRAIDLGCGTGILAMALVKGGVKDVTATDNDPDAIMVTRENIRRNHLPPTAIKTWLAAGFRHQALARKYDLVVANILAGPLIRLAPDIARHLAPGGAVILSGLLRVQEKEVLAAYSSVGLKRRQHFHSGEWSALLLNS